ncbi:MAG TPA: hypothetical protein VGI10_26310 [Polyangiaceae bacterium]|jgi:hypothetical protein
MTSPFHARLALAIAVLACAGCGARFSAESGDDTATAGSGAGGTAGSAGTGGSAGGVCVVSCISIACASGSHLETEPGMCCPSCVPDSSTCADGQSQYAMLRSELLTPDTSACMADGDCTFLYEPAACGYPCVSALINTWSGPSIQQKLNAFGQTACASCSSLSPPCPLLPATACCNGRCTVGSCGPD